MRVQRTAAEYAAARVEAAEQASKLLERLPKLALTPEFVASRRRLATLQDRLAVVTRQADEGRVRRAALVEEIAAAIADDDDRAAKSARVKLRALHDEGEEADTSLPVLEQVLERAKLELAEIWRRAVGAAAPAFAEAARAAAEAALEAEQRYDVACQVARRLQGAVGSLSYKADHPPLNGDGKGAHHG